MATCMAKAATSTERDNASRTKGQPQGCPFR